MFVLKHQAGRQRRKFYRHKHENILKSFDVFGSIFSQLVGSLVVIVVVAAAALGFSGCDLFL